MHHKSTNTFLYIPTDYIDITAFQNNNYTVTTYSLY